MPQPVVAAFMPVLNEGRHIRRAISSLQEQTYPLSHLVVVDGGSTDDTQEVVRDLAAEVDFEIDLHVLPDAGVRHSSQFGAERAASHLAARADTGDGLVVRLEGDSALGGRFVELAASRLADDTVTAFGAPVKPHHPRTKPIRKRLFMIAQNAEMLPKGRAMAFRAADFNAVDGYRINPDEDISHSEIDCLEDGILVSKLQERGEVAFSHETCVYSSVPSTSATSPRRWWTAFKIERRMGPTNYFTKIANPLNTLVYARRRLAGLR